MKNVFKFGFTAMVVMVLAAACNGAGNPASEDSAKTDSVVADTPHAIDIVAKPIDITKKDTIKK